MPICVFKYFWTLLQNKVPQNDIILTATMKTLVMLKLKLYPLCLVGFKEQLQLTEDTCRLLITLFLLKKMSCERV